MSRFVLELTGTVDDGWTESDLDDIAAAVRSAAESRGASKVASAVGWLGVPESPYPGDPDRADDPYDGEHSSLRTRNGQFGNDAA